MAAKRGRHEVKGGCVEVAVSHIVTLCEEDEGEEWSSSVFSFLFDGDFTRGGELTTALKLLSLASLTL